MGILERLNPKAQQMKAPPAEVRDAVGKTLEVGDEVLVVSPSTTFRVASIRPILHPGAPPNTMEVLLVTRLQLAVPRGSALNGLYQLRHQAEIGDNLFPEGQEQAGQESQAPHDEDGGEPRP